MPATGTTPLSLRFHNTLTREVEAFVPINPAEVGLYTCGPTVYGYAHIGNLRAYVFEDLLRRTLEYAGYPVRQVMNLTDVDDKTIRASREGGVPLRAYTETFKQAFFEDLRALNIRPAAVYPAATDHIPEMIDLVRRLFDRGLAYASDDGSVYFSIDRFPGYGKLAHLDLSGLRPGARVGQDEYDKENLGDFALWKAWSPEDGDVAWDSPWGRGRPGWHIECSAMSMRYLGESFDIHCGGIDNIFPHHEDEIAQSEGATGQPFVRYWLHNAHLIVEGRKMSKSLGNVFTLRDLAGRGYTGREVRFVLLTHAHYRQTLNFMMAGLDGARTALQRLDEFRARVGEAVGAVAEEGGLPEWAAQETARFEEALADDLNISAAMAAVFDLVREGNRRMDQGLLAARDAGAVNRTLDRFDRVLGFLAPASAATGPGPEVQVLVERRQAARAAKDWGESDRLRDDLKALGWLVKDTPEGPKLQRVGP